MLNCWTIPCEHMSIPGRLGNMESALKWSDYERLIFSERTSKAWGRVRITLALILQLLYGFLFFFGGVGWSNLLIFTDFQLSLPFPFLLSSPSTPLSLSFPNLRAAPPLKPLVLSQAVSCAVWEGLEGNGGEKRGHY